jgi:hypothetical protein
MARRFLLAKNNGPERDKGEEGGKEGANLLVISAKRLFK